MKNLMILLLMIALAVMAFFYIQKPDGNNQYEHTAGKQKLEQTNAEKSTDTNNELLNFATGVSNVDEKISVVEYDDTAKIIDENYQQFIESAVDVNPHNEDFKDIFANEESAGKYFDQVINDIENHANEANLMANRCLSQSKTMRKRGDIIEDNHFIYASTLLDRCNLLLGDNDVFFAIERVAELGDSNYQLDFLMYLQDAIRRKAINPMVDPFKYMEKRDKGFMWLNQLARKGVGVAAAKLSEYYQYGVIIEKDWAAAYFYGDMALNSPIKTTISIYQLENIKNQLNEKELSRLNRISGGRLP